DLRNAPSGQSSGPLEIDRPWDSYTDDHLGLMDHLGAKRFMVLGFCIGGPFIWNLVKRAPDRIVAAVVSQPVGFRKEIPTLAYDSYMKSLEPDLTKQRPDVTTETIERFLTSMYGGSRADFVHSVSRDVVRSCPAPVLVMPDDSPPHPYLIAMESAMLAPKSEVSMYPWKDTKEKIPLAVRQVRTFLRAYRPAACRSSASSQLDAQQLGGGLAEDRAPLGVGEARRLQDVVDRLVLPRDRMVGADHEPVRADLGREMPQRLGGEHERVVV